MTRARDIASSGGLVLISSATIGSAVSSVAVTNAFSATYDNYKIIISGGVGSVDTELKMILGATTAGYYQAYWGVGYGGGALVSSGGLNTAQWNDVGVARSTNGLDMNMDIFSPFIAKNTYFTTRRISTNQSLTSQGYLANTTSYTGFTVSPISGTLTGGTISVYGYKN